MRDEETGLYYLRARYYDPEIGRFISKDPVPGILSAPQTLNQYVYCINNPLKYTDPTGEWPSWDEVFQLMCPVYGMYQFTIGTYNWWANEASDEEKAGFLAGITTAFIIGLAIGLAIPTGGASLLLLAVVPVAAGFMGAATYTLVTAGLGGEPTWEGFGYSFGWGMIAGSAGFGVGQYIQKPTASNLPSNVRDSFGSKPVARISQGNVHGYQYGSSPSYISRYSTSTKFASANSARLGLNLPEYNTAHYYRQVTIPRGVPYWEGTVEGGAFPGVLQRWVPNPNLYIYGPPILLPP